MFFKRLARQDFPLQKPFCLSSVKRVLTARDRRSSLLQEAARLPRLGPSRRWRRRLGSAAADPGWEGGAAVLKKDQPCLLQVSDRASSRGCGAALAMEPGRAQALLLSCWALLALASAAEDVSTVLPAVTAKTADPADDHVFESANILPSRSEAAAVQPVVGISQRVKMRTNEKKDLGTLGYVLGLIMMVIIIAIGAGIIVGYIYKRGKDLKEQHEQKAYEREMQRITLPLSAFTNQACELVDENTVVVHTTQTPVEEMQNGDAPLMGQAGTPGA
ncbi:phosphoinositide-3-kinase-interacting protein 1 [Eublepharis macularius]|uniref:Phosphoinositide-3-kinase-interacting protein 1 n=1 Tax=Eublepharis macularius TaxID=481883 RepID=A0AA97K5F9_EUBMA|nr:phosphoinositide-3-kinase-interacting protein 1 [Eublepharis macularius]